MMKLPLIIAISCSISSVVAQTIAVMPQNVSGVGSIQVGNTVAGKCDGLSANFVKVSVQPSCYGANLRSGGTALNPDAGDVEMDLTITNSGSSYASTVRFPNKVTWPENYGQSCKWSSTKPLSTVTCDQQGSTVSYTCKYITSDFFIRDSLECTRSGDPLTHGALNSNISCGFLYTWKGENYGAGASYKQVTNFANWGLRDKEEDWANLMTVTSSTPASSITKYSKRGKVVVAYNGLGIKKQSVVKDNTTGNFIVSGSRSQVDAKFYQYGADGVRRALTQRVDASFDEFEECLEVKAAFLGTNQFCGSYYSPIMMFFDNELPQFAGTSSFPLVPGVKMIYWPEAKAPGYFLAVDEHDTGAISNNKQLFGESADYKNGFEALMRYDSNKDGVIDSKDKMFSKLVLWKDANGNGVSEKEEMFSLDSRGVKSISLKYTDDKRQSFGRRAEARQEAPFTFVKDGKEQSGRAIDIWFSPNTMANKAPVKKAKK